MVPSRQTLATAFPELTREKIALLRAIMKGTAPKICKGCRGDMPSDRICRYYHDGQCRYSRMDRIDVVLGTHGVEYVPAGHNAKSPAFYYCNAGDTYATTIIKVRGRFRVGCWGVIVERGNYD